MQRTLRNINVLMKRKPETAKIGHQAVMYGVKLSIHALDYSSLSTDDAKDMAKRPIVVLSK